MLQRVDPDNPLRLRSIRNPLSQVTTRNKVVSALVATGDDVEVLHHKLPRGTRFGLIPAPGGKAFEAIVVVEGRIRCLTPQPAELVPGDTFAQWPIREPHIFEACENSLVVHISSKPMFDDSTAAFESLRKVAREVALRDGYTHEHCLRVQNLAGALAIRATLPADSIHWLLLGAFLHDVGKSKVPPEIITKPGPLDRDEWQVMRQHPSWGREMVEGSPIGEAGHIIEQHHERLDGSGYPRGLSGSRIPVESQIVSIADTWDAIVSDRPYHQGESPEAAMRELRRCSSILFDPELVEMFLSLPETMSPEAKP